MFPASIPLLFIVTGPTFKLPVDPKSTSFFNEYVYFCEPVAKFCSTSKFLPATNWTSSPGITCVDVVDPLKFPPASAFQVFPSSFATANNCEPLIASVLVAVTLPAATFWICLSFPADPTENAASGLLPAKVP